MEEDGGNGEDATSAQLSSIQGLAIKYIGLNRTCFCSKSGEWTRLLWLLLDCDEDEEDGGGGGVRTEYLRNEYL